MEGALLSCQGGLGGRCASELQEWCGAEDAHTPKALVLSTIHRGDPAAGCLVPGPKLPHGFPTEPSCYRVPFPAHTCHLTTQSWQREEKLGTICAWSSLCHRQGAMTRMLLETFSFSNFSSWMDLPPAKHVWGVKLPFWHLNPGIIVQERDPL